MRIVAFPVFQSRIAPVFDSAARVLLVDIEHQRDRGRSELYTKNQSRRERVDSLKRAGVNTLVCAGISNIMHTMLEGANIRVRPGIVGQVEEVISAYLKRRLDDPQFCMPGHTGRRAGRSRTASRRPRSIDGAKTGSQTKRTHKERKGGMQRPRKNERKR